MHRSPPPPLMSCARTHRLKKRNHRPKPKRNVQNAKIQSTQYFARQTIHPHRSGSLYTTTLHRTNTNIKLALTCPAVICQRRSGRVLNTHTYPHRCQSELNKTEFIDLVQRTVGIVLIFGARSLHSRAVSCCSCRATTRRTNLSQNHFVCMLACFVFW